MTATLNGYSVKQIDELIRKEKTQNAVAKIIGVTPQKLSMFKGQNKKAFNRLQADFETGVMIEELPAGDKDLIKKMRDDYNDLEESHVNLEEQHEKLMAEHKELTSDYKFMVKKLKTQQDEADSIADAQAAIMNKAIDKSNMLAKKVEAFEKEVAVLKNKSADQVADIVDENKQLAERVKQMVDKYEYDELYKKLRKSEQYVDTLKRQKDEAAKKQQEAQSRYNEYKRLADKNTKNYESAMRAANFEIQRLKSELEKEKQKKIDDTAQRIDKTAEQLKSEFNAEFEKMELKHADQIAAYEKERNGLLGRIEELEQSKPAPAVQQIDIVSRPQHYNYGDIEVIDFIEQVVSTYDSINGYRVGSVLKYIARAPLKNGLEDLKKAEWFLSRTIKNMEVAE